jgi:hypothetical protein
MSKRLQYLTYTVDTLAVYHCSSLLSFVPCIISCLFMCLYILLGPLPVLEAAIGEFAVPTLATGRAAYTVCV